MEEEALTKFEIKHFKNKKKNQKKETIIKIIIYLICLLVSFASGLLIGTKMKIRKNPEKINRTNIKKLDFNNFTSYSQYLEDFVLYCIFYDIENGFYIDVGANDPNHISVSKYFYLNGWHGMNIEPLPDMYQKLLTYRNRDINLNIGAGEKDDILPLYMQNVGSTLNKMYSKNISQVINITVHPMSKICKMHMPKNEEIQFCKIDVEGYEKYVLLGYDFENYRPKVFCIESTKPGTINPLHKEWENILLKNGYAFGFKYVINRFYYDTKVDYLKERFLNLENNMKEYKESRKRKKKLI